MRVEKVAKFIGQVIGRKYDGSLESFRFARLNRPFRGGAFSTMG